MACKLNEKKKKKKINKDLLSKRKLKAKNFFFYKIDK